MILGGTGIQVKGQSKVRRSIALGTLFFSMVSFANPAPSIFNSIINRERTALNSISSSKTERAKIIENALGEIKESVQITHSKIRQAFAKQDRKCLLREFNQRLGPFYFAIGADEVQTRLEGILNYSPDFALAEIIQKSKKKEVQLYFDKIADTLDQVARENEAIGALHRALLARSENPISPTSQFVGDRVAYEFLSSFLKNLTQIDKQNSSKLTENFIITLSKSKEFSKTSLFSSVAKESIPQLSVSTRDLLLKRQVRKIGLLPELKNEIKTALQK